MEPTVGGSFSGWAQTRGSGGTAPGGSAGRSEGFAQLAKSAAISMVAKTGDVRMERWLDVVGWEGLYRVSSEGRVSGPRRSILRPFVNKRGYPQIGLCRNGSRRTVFIHQMVADAFLGPRPDGMECRHLDGDSGNAREENLCWGTHSENALDAVRHGANPIGVDHPHAKLTPEIAAIIRRRYRPYCRKWGGRACAERFGVSTGAVSALVRGITWKVKAHPTEGPDRQAL